MHICFLCMLNSFLSLHEFIWWWSGFSTAKGWMSLIQTLLPTYLMSFSHRKVLHMKVLTFLPLYPELPKVLARWHTEIYKEVQEGCCTRLAGDLDCISPVLFSSQFFPLPLLNRAIFCCSSPPSTCTYVGVPHTCNLTTNYTLSVNPVILTPYPVWHRWRGAELQ